ncbi:MAG TPA: hypothetical protein VMX75_02240 [Spirochaetia bacterium]|nr:hypothetical protein [Spirochaetia bacterium]
MVPATIKAKRKRFHKKMKLSIAAGRGAHHDRGLSPGQAMPSFLTKVSSLPAFGDVHVKIADLFKLTNWLTELSSGRIILSSIPSGVLDPK